MFRGRQYRAEPSQPPSPTRPIRYTKKEEDFLERVRSTANGDSDASIDEDWFALEQDKDPSSQMMVRAGLVSIDGKMKRLHIGKAERVIAFPSYSVMNWFWDWVK